MVRYFDFNTYQKMTSCWKRRGPRLWHIFFRFGVLIFYFRSWSPERILLGILIWLDSFPPLIQRTRTVLYSPDISTGSKPRPPVLHVTAVSRVNFLFSFFHKKDISWVIIRIEIKMKSSALLPSKFASCHRPIKSVYHLAANLIGRWHSANY